MRQNRQSSTQPRIADVAIAAVMVTYLLSSISFPYLVARMYGVDLRAVGQRKLGCGNLAKSVGLAQGIVAAPSTAPRVSRRDCRSRAWARPRSTARVRLAALIGQMLRCSIVDGGRANATGWGFALAADPIAAVIMGVPLYVGLLAVRLIHPRPTRLLPLASLLSFAIFPAVIWEQEGVTPTVVAGVIVLGLILLRRITAGIRDDLPHPPLARVLSHRR